MLRDAEAVFTNVLLPLSKIDTTNPPARLPRAYPGSLLFHTRTVPNIVSRGLVGEDANKELACVFAAAQMSLTAQ